MSNISVHMMDRVVYLAESGGGAGGEARWTNPYHRQRPSRICYFYFEVFPSLVSQPAHTVGMFIYLLEMLVFVLSLTILLLMLWRWVSPLYSSPLQLNDQQYRLLGLDPNTPGFCRSPEKGEVKYPNPFTPLSGSLINSPKQSPASPTTSSTPVNTSMHSWMSSSGTSSPAFSPASNTSLNTSANLRRDHYTGMPTEERYFGQSKPWSVLLVFMGVIYVF